MKKIFSVLMIIVLLPIMAACNMPTWLTYTNATYGFELQYPPGGSIAAGGSDTATRINLPFTSGTNLSEKYLEISVVDGASPCQSPQASGWEPGSLSPETVNLASLTWTKESAAEGAAGSIYRWTAYSTVHGSLCVSLTFVLHSHNPGMYPTPPATYSEPSETSVFALIVNTFTWLEATATPVPGAWLTYTNVSYGFQLRYPAGGGGLQPGDTAVAARIDLPFTPGTSLVEKYLAIDVSHDPSDCSSTYGGGATPVPMTIAGLVWQQDNGGEGAAGNIYQWTTYSTVSGIICVRLNFVLHSHSADVEPTLVPTYDDAAERAVFIQIVETFVWLSGAAVTPTFVSTYTPTPVITDTPTPVSSPSFHPKLNAYCRIGPDPVFNSVGLAMKGQVYVIDGRNQENTYFLIWLTKNIECWVLQSTGEASGDLSKIRVMLPIPTPTFTPPPLDCTKYVDRKSCSAVPACKWTQLSDLKGMCTNK